MNSLSDSIAALHAAWETSSGQKLHRAAGERIFYELARADVTPEDLAVTVQHLIAMNRRFGTGAGFRINLQKVAGDLETFLCLVAEARAAKRNYRPAPTAKEQAIEQLRPTVDKEQATTITQTNGRHISEVFDNIRKAI